MGIQDEREPIVVVKDTDGTPLVYGRLEEGKVPPDMAAIAGRVGTEPTVLKDESDQPKP